MFEAAFKRLRQEGGDKNIIALLSLKLLLLAFFILLTALSSFEEQKTRAVLESVNETFSGRSTPSRHSVSFTQALDNLDDKAELVAEIGKLFESVIPAIEKKIGASQKYLRLSMKTEMLFNGGERDLASGRELLLKRLSDALQRFGEKGGVYEVEFLYGQPAKPVEPTSTGAFPIDQRALLRSDAVIRQLLKSGLPADKLALGFQPGEAGKVFFVIRLYEEPVEAVTFKELEEGQ